MAICAIAAALQKSYSHICNLTIFSIFYFQTILQSVFFCYTVDGLICTMRLHILLPKTLIFLYAPRAASIVAQRYFLFRVGRLELLYNRAR